MPATARIHATPGRALRRAALLPLVLALAGLPAGAATAADTNPVPHTHAHLPDSTLDLAALERAVLERNPSYAAMRAAVRAARARVDAEGALGYPMLRLMAAPQSFAGGGSESAWRADIELPLPVFGQRGSRRGVAMADADAGQASLETARLDLIREARAAFYDDFHFDQVGRTSQELRDLVGRARASALARYAAGTAPQQDVLDADVELAMLEHQAVSAERSQLLVEARIRALLHMDPLTLLPAPPDSLPVPDPLDAVRLVARSNESRRPETRAVEAEIRGAEARLALARQGRLPEPSLGFTYDRYMLEPEMRPSVSLSMALPIAPGRRDAEERAAEATLEGAEARRNATLDELHRRIADASTEYEETLHELEVIRDRLLPATERSLASAQAGYEAGRADFSSWIKAARDLATARLEYHRVLAGANQARADFERALGEPAAPDQKESGR